MVNLTTSIHKTSVDPKPLQVEMCIHNNQRKCTTENFSPVLNELFERFRLLVAGDKIDFPQELNRQVVDALHFGLPGYTKTLARKICLSGPGFEGT